MTLLSPLFLLGLLGIALPLWLHRLQTQTKDREPFSSAMFLEPSEQRIHVQRRLRYLLLLALRILFLILLVLAFTRPVWQTPVEAVLGDEARHHVIVIDGSLSMQAGERLDAARERARGIVRDMDGNDLASLYRGGDRLDTLVERSGDRQALMAAIDDVSADESRLNLGQMMAALGGALPELEERIELHIISDFQQSGRPVRFADLIPRGISGRDLSLHTERVAEQSPGNWHIASVEASTEGVDVSVRGHDTESAERRLRLSVNGTEHDTLSQTVPADGEARYHFEDPELAEGDNQLLLELPGDDALAADNRRHAVLDNSPPAPVLVVTTDPESLSITYLEAALGASPRPYEAEVVTLSDLDPRVMQRYAWVIIDDLGAVNANLAESITDYLTGGGAVFAALGEQSRGLDEIPVGGQGLRSGIIRSTEDEDFTITRIDTSHPALSDADGWSGVNISSALSIEPGEEDNVLIGLNRETPFLLEREVGLGRLMLLNGTLNNTWTDLPLRPVFVSFLAETARHLSGEDILQRERTLHDSLQLQASGGGSGQVYSPDGERLLRLEDTSEPHSLRLNQTGFYQVFTSEGERFVAVNPDNRESDLAPMPVQSLQNWQQSVAATATGTAAAREPSGAVEEENTIEREIWRVILVLLVIMVLAESLLGNRHLASSTGTPTGRPT